MVDTIKIKRSSTLGASPSSLQDGEIALNTADGRLFYGNGTSVSTVGRTFTFPFTVSSWVLSGSVYSFPIPFTTHLTINPQITIKDSNNLVVEIDEIVISNTNDLIFRIPSTPNLRFAGTILIS